MTEFPDSMKADLGATRAPRGPEAPLLEIFWGKGDEAKALSRECLEIVSRQYGSAAVTATKPARRPHKPSLARLVAKAKQLGVDVTVEPDGAVTFRTGTVSMPDDKPQTDLAEWIARQHAH